MSTTFLNCTNIDCSFKGSCQLFTDVLSPPPGLSTQPSNSKCLCGCYRIQHRPVLPSGPSQAVDPSGLENTANAETPGVSNSSRPSSRLADRIAALAAESRRRQEQASGSTGGSRFNPRQAGPTIPGLNNTRDKKSTALYSRAKGRDPNLYQLVWLLSNEVLDKNQLLEPNQPDLQRLFASPNNLVYPIRISPSASSNDIQDAILAAIRSSPLITDHLSKYSADLSTVRTCTVSSRGDRKRPKIISRGTVASITPMDLPLFRRKHPKHPNFPSILYLAMPRGLPSLVLPDDFATDGSAESGEEDVESDESPAHSTRSRRSKRKSDHSPAVTDDESNNAPPLKKPRSESSTSAGGPAPSSSFTPDNSALPESRRMLPLTHGLLRLVQNMQIQEGNKPPLLYRDLHGCCEKGLELIQADLFLPADEARGFEIFCALERLIEVLVQLLILCEAAHTNTFIGKAGLGPFFDALPKITYWLFLDDSSVRLNSYLQGKLVRSIESAASRLRFAITTLRFLIGRHNYDPPLYASLLTTLLENKTWFKEANINDRRRYLVEYPNLAGCTFHQFHEEITSWCGDVSDTLYQIPKEYLRTGEHGLHGLYNSVVAPFLDSLDKSNCSDFVEKSALVEVLVEKLDSAVSMMIFSPPSPRGKSRPNTKTFWTDFGDSDDESGNPVNSDTDKPPKPSSPPPPSPDPVSRSPPRNPQPSATPKSDVEEPVDATEMATKLKKITTLRGLFAFIRTHHTHPDPTARASVTADSLALLADDRHRIHAFLRVYHEDKNPNRGAEWKVRCHVICTELLLRLSSV